MTEIDIPPIPKPVAWNKSPILVKIFPAWVLTVLTDWPSVADLLVKAHQAWFKLQVWTNGSFISSITSWGQVGWGGGGGGMRWDGMGWDEMRWDEMGWDGMGWDGVGWGQEGWSEVLLENNLKNKNYLEPTQYCVPCNFRSQPYLKSSILVGL